MKYLAFLAGLMAASSAAQASTVGFSSSATLLFEVTDLDGQVIDLSSGEVGIFASSSLSTAITDGTIVSGDSDSIDLVNDTGDVVLVSWEAFTDAFVEYVIFSDTVQPATVLEVTAFAGTSLGFDAFAAASTSYSCSAADLADPLIFCDGVSGGDDSFNSGSGTIELAAGDSLFLSVETAPLIIASVEDDTPAVVPLPASGWALMAGLFGLGLVSRRRKAI